MDLVESNTLSRREISRLTFLMATGYVHRPHQLTGLTGMVVPEPT
jgi:hypothetical protein